MDNADVLNYMQMEALGLHRREKITTSDHIENRQFTSVSELENARRELGAGYKPPKQSKLKISDWQNVHHFIQDDGTAGPEDLQNINEGLGQTHRAKLIENPDVRAYSGEADSRKDRYRHTGNVTKRNNAVTIQKAHEQPGRQRVTRGRVVKGDSASKTTSSVDAKGLLAPGIKSITSHPGKARDAKTSSERVMESVQRQREAIKRSAPLVDPRAFIASMRSPKLHTSLARQMTPTTTDTVMDTAKNVPEATTPHSDNMLSSQGPSIAPARIGGNPTLQNFEPLAQKHKPFEKASNLSEEVASSAIRQEQLPVAMSNDAGAVSLAYLMSLSIKFTPEQLRLLKAHSRGTSKVNTELETPASPEQKLLNPLSPDRHLDDTSTPLAQTISPKAPLVNYESSSSDSTPTSPVLSKNIPTATANQASPIPSISAGGREQKRKTTASASARVSIAKSLPLATMETSGLSDRLIPLSGLKLPETIEATNELSSSKVRPFTTSNTFAPIKFTLPPTPASVTTISHENPLLQGTSSASAISRSETLRQQREMIIGPQVYRNRYSHVAGSLVDKFKALSLKDSAPTSRSTTAATPVAIDLASSAPLLASSPAIKHPPKVQNLLRPRFIPDQPASFQSSALAPKSVNGSAEETMRSQATRSMRSSGLSLPSHLRGKTADRDAGAAARAQYGI